VNTATEAETEALERSRAFAVPPTRIVRVRGGDARGWLHDLVTADVESLADGASRRSLLLTPTGRIRADVHVAATPGAFLLLQAPDQPETIDAILRPYVLSSDVELVARDDLRVIAVLGDDAVEADDAESNDVPAILRPSTVAAHGADLLVPHGAPLDRVRDRLLGRGLVEVGTAALEARRIRRGIPRMQTDFGQDALPAEAGLEDLIDFQKGCFLGQESVAKVRNLGHPPRVLVPVRAPAGTVAGVAVVAIGNGDPVGEVTSATAGDGGVDAIVRVRWDASSEPLSTNDGPLSLRRRG
jgi:folate-binding protein YgfZ